MVLGIHEVGIKLPYCVEPLISKWGATYLAVHLAWAGGKQEIQFDSEPCLRFVGSHVVDEYC